MATISSSTSEHPAIVRATFVWAIFTALITITVALPFLLLGPAFVVGSFFEYVPLGEIAGCMVASALAGLYLYGVMRCLVLSTAHVRRWPGYPARHWWFLSRAYRSILMTQVVLLVAGVGLTAYAVYGHGRLADRVGVAAALVDGLFLFLPSLSLLGMNGVLRHAAVVPYYPRAVGETRCFSHGENLARHVAQLDAIALSLGVTPLSDFGWNDDMEKEPLVWHESSEGLRTIDALLSQLESDPPRWDDLSEAVADLNRISHDLSRADAKGIPFCLLLRHASATNGQEWEVRKGTCF